MASARSSDLARHAGFVELGRLAALYRAAFGETSSVTLRRARDRGDGNLRFAENP
jgi:hypothetical protein